VNAGPTGGDQVYLSWRQFTNIGCLSSNVPGNEDASLTCSPNSGGAGTWLAPVLVDAAGDRPRPAVAPDGTVYVVYVLGDGGPVQVHRFTSCANGLTAVAGYPYAVTGSSAVTGVTFLDRQGQEGNAVIGIDPFNSSLIYVVYGLDTSGASSGDPGIFLRISTDGGVSWGAAIQINDNVANNTSRYFPWLAVNPADSSVVIGWYDRRDDPANNDLTAYFGARVTGGGTPTVTVSPNFRISEVDYAASQPGVVCSSPLYGDYNAVAAGPEFMYAAWVSPVSPLRIQPPSVSVDVFFAAIVAGDIPQIQPSGLLDYGNVCVGSSTTKDLNICNSGKTDLVVNSITSSDPEFAVVSATFPLVISPDACFPVQVKFTPSSSGSLSATLTIQSNDPTNPSVTVQAIGNGAQQTIATTIADSGNVGNVCVSAFKDLDLTISNTGGCSLSVTNITSTLPGEFKTASTSAFPLTIGAGTSVHVPIRLEPTTIGAKLANITISSNDPVTPNKVVAVSGNAPSGQILVSPNPLTFGNVPVTPACGGETDHQDLQFQVHNQGACNLKIHNVFATGGNASDFTVLPTVPGFDITLSPDADFFFTVRFDPSAAGPRTTTLRVNSDSGQNPGTFATNTDVTAQGNLAAGAGQPDIQVTNSLNFFKNVAPKHFLERVVSIHNTGSSNLNITNISLTNTTDFSIQGPPSLPLCLSPDSHADIVVRCSPVKTKPYVKTTTFSVASNDPDTPTASIAGTCLTKGGLR